MEKVCNASAATPAECVACEAKHKAALQHAGCDGGPGSKLARFCGGAPTPPGPARPPAPAPPPTPDCPNGVANPCKEPATPKISSGFASYNLFWPLAHPNPSHRHHTRTPHTSFANQHRRVQGRAGCRGSRVQLHLLPKRRLGKRIPAGGRGGMHAGGLLRVQRHPHLRAPRQCAGRCRPRSCHPELQRGLREDIGRSCSAKYFSFLSPFRSTDLFCGAGRRIHLDQDQALRRQTWHDQLRSRAQPRAAPIPRPLLRSKPGRGGAGY